MIPLLVMSLLGSFALAWWITGRVRRMALHRGALDVPNARSSHSVPTPRGGGVGFVIPCVACSCVFAATGLAHVGPAFAIAAGGTIVAAIGAWDDMRGLPASRRLLVHLATVAMAQLMVGLVDLPAALGLTLPLHAGAVITLVGGTWLLNATNFMDGIDGLAAAEAVTACLGAAVCAAITGASVLTVSLPLLLAAGVAGFLVWNWPPARIFMGDAGSGFLGFSFAVLLLAFADEQPRLAWCWMILLGVFLVDASATLTRRLLRGDAVTQAHRSHAYQRASRRLGGHRPVLLLVIAINACWLVPLALLVASGRLPGVPGVVLAYAPLLWLALREGAGLPDSVPRFPARATDTGLLP